MTSTPPAAAGALLESSGRWPTLALPHPPLPSRSSESRADGFSAWADSETGSHRNRLIKSTSHGNHCDGMISTRRAAPVAARPCAESNTGSHWHCRSHSVTPHPLCVHVHMHVCARAVSVVRVCEYARRERLRIGAHRRVCRRCRRLSCREGRRRVDRHRRSPSDSGARLCKPYSPAAPPHGSENRGSGRPEAWLNSELLSQLSCQLRPK